MLRRFVFLMRVAAIRRWLARSADSDSGYATEAYIAQRWPRLGERERRAMLKQAAEGL